MLVTSAPGRRSARPTITRYHPAPPPLQPRIKASRMIVPMMETAIEPRQPRRLEKKANIKRETLRAAYSAVRQKHNRCSPG